ncbi:MAG: von Willebrand factor type A domain-containing protein [Saprospirales bacterium]|nr:von Willebrand factor type A domain-containing protein [Saprospirales bacterium]
MLRCSLLALCFFCISLGFGQVIITGQVFSSFDNAPLQGAHILVKGTGEGVATDQRGEFYLVLSPSETELEITYPGYTKLAYSLMPGDSVLILTLDILPGLVDTVLTFDPETYEEPVQVVRKERSNPLEIKPMMKAAKQDWNTEDYSPIEENNEKLAFETPLSTFSIDVDRAAYANVRRFTNQGQRPPKDAVRIEEMVNYFNYDYPAPKGEHPVEMYTELSDCPWNADRKLLHIGLQGKNADLEKLPPSNLVFLLDVSGSMDSPEKLPLLKSAFELLVEQLRPEDRVAIVVYAGAAGLVLPSRSGADKEEILKAIENLRAGGSTAGGAGIQLAYQTAKDHFLKPGNNRVILATDGDFNVGVSSDAELVRMIEEKRQEGIFLTVLGFGTGNYKDNKMEMLADKGNGNYAYIDNLKEAKKIFVSEFLGTLYAIAKDVKIQVEFNPFQVKSYRLVGYENRVLQSEDFEDDQKDAGELGLGHSVTALYELELIDPASRKKPKDAALRYQQTTLSPEATKSGEIAHIAIRYKLPESETSKLIDHPVDLRYIPLGSSSDRFRFSAAVAGFGMLLRESEYNRDLDFEKLRGLAADAMGQDEDVEKEEFLMLVERQGELAGEE